METKLSYVTPKELPRFLASKWLSYHILCDTEDWMSLFTSYITKNCLMWRAAGLFPPSDLFVTQAEFLHIWSQYQAALRAKDGVDDVQFRSSLSLYLTLDPCALVAVTAPADERQMVQPVAPCVVIQVHRFYAITDPYVKVVTGVFSQDAISWGVTVSFPQIIQQESSREVYYTLKDEKYKNRLLWTAIQQFIRQETTPTPLIIDGNKIWSVLRLGKKAQPWIHQHRGLNNSQKITLNLEKLDVLLKR